MYTSRGTRARPTRGVHGANGSMTMDVWVNGKDLPVRMKQRFGSVSVTTDFEKSGKTATVKAPPAAQTGDLTAELKKARQRQEQG